MKVLTMLLAVLLGIGIGAGSSPRIAAQTAGPQTCPHSGMMQHGGMMHSGMMMQGMHGPADHAYMQSMMSMHQGMRGQHFTGDADRDFMVMMIPHHQAAIDMAKAELQYGKNPKLRAMAESIVKAQQAEIDQMRAMLQ
jgi:uncharacterized protein (DUF305 family)